MNQTLGPSVEAAAPRKAEAHKGRAGAPARTGAVKAQVKKLLYRLYEHRLLRQVRHGVMPGHIGIILDGNRRHGVRQGITDPQAVYSLGANKLNEVLDWCGEFRIPVVTLWVLSTDNLSRSTAQVSSILMAIEEKLVALATDPEIHHRRVRVQAIGRLDLLPGSTLAAIETARKATAPYDSMVLNIAVAYGGRDEIVDSVRAFLAQEARRGGTIEETINRVTTAAISENLYMSDVPDPDLIIRTSGEIRLSGFLLWQSAYSEFYFSDVNWPAFRKIDFLRAIRSYQERQRRFGA